MCHHNHLKGIIVSLENTFTQIAAINEMVGNHAGSERQALIRQAKILRSEIDELIEGLEANDMHEIRDGQADVAFVLAGFEHMSGIPIVPDLQAVIRSNLSKFDRTHLDAILTAEKYDALGLKTRCEVRTVPAELREQLGESVYVTYVDGNQLFNDKSVPDGKWMKSHKFQEPVFDHNEGSEEHVAGNQE